MRSLDSPGSGGVGQEDTLLLDGLWAEDMPGGAGEPDGRLNTPTRIVEISPPNPGGLHMGEIFPEHLAEEALCPEHSRGKGIPNLSMRIHRG